MYPRIFTFSDLLAQIYKRDHLKNHVSYKVTRVNYIKVVFSTFSRPKYSYCQSKFKFNPTPMLLKFSILEKVSSSWIILLCLSKLDIWWVSCKIGDFEGIWINKRDVYTGWDFVSGDDGENLL